MPEYTEQPEETTSGDSGGADSDHEGEAEFFCTFALTGEHEYFQEIYLCRTCSPADTPLCICQACADACHDDHDGMEYVGMGPAYCDCHKMSSCCKIQEVSQNKAAEIGLKQGAICDRTGQIKATGEFDTYLHEPYRIRELESTSLCDDLCKQAEALVSQSRDTFWIDETLIQTLGSNLCALEKFTWTVYKRHVEHYNLTASSTAGAEFWVQVKQVSQRPESEEKVYNSCPSGSEAVDLHYDKDETLAEIFSLGSFPVLSTVTYLTHSVHSPPTIVIPQLYETSQSGNDTSIPYTWISHSRKGKHIVFDGRLLHGAPAHFALRPAFDIHNEHKVVDGQEVDTGVRITFLVNIWTNQKPASVMPLSGSIRDSLVASTASSSKPYAHDTDQIVFEKAHVTTIEVPSVRDTSSHYEMITLPFLGSGTTWETTEGERENNRELKQHGDDGDDDDDDDDKVDNSQTVVRILPPPAGISSDTILLKQHADGELASKITTL